MAKKLCQDDSIFGIFDLKPISDMIFTWNNFKDSALLAVVCSLVPKYMKSSAIYPLCPLMTTHSQSENQNLICRQIKIAF